MRQEIQAFIKSRPDLKRFIREQPYWYRFLSRHPEEFAYFEEQSKMYFGKTFPQRMDKVQQNLQMASMLMSMLSAMGEQN